VLDEAQEAKEHGKLVAVRIDDVDLPWGSGVRDGRSCRMGGRPGAAGVQKLVGGAESLIGRAPGHLPLRGQLGAVRFAQKVTFRPRSNRVEYRGRRRSGIAVYAWYALLIGADR